MSSQTTQRESWLIFAFFIALITFLRFSSFFQSVIAGDEGNYVLVARSILDGHPPYTAVWDNKPPGIYVLFALAFTVFGNSVLAIRIIACLAVSITCYFLYRLGKLIGQEDPKVGLLAGVLYGVFSLNNNGIGANTEIFYTPFVVFAFYLLFAIKNNATKPIEINHRKLFVIGLAMGVGLQIKQVVIFDFLAILIIVGIHSLSQNLNNNRSKALGLLNCYFWLIFGLIVPTILIIIYYVAIGHFDEYFYANFIANSKRVAGGISLTVMITTLFKQVKNHFILWLGLFLAPLFLMSYTKNDSELRRNVYYLLLWTLMSFLAIVAQKKFYDYSFLQLLPSLCLLSAFMIIKTAYEGKELHRLRERFRNWVLLSLILGTPILLTIYPVMKQGVSFGYYRYVKGVENWGDCPAIVAQYLSRNVSHQDYIYDADYNRIIIYYLVGAKIPTKYPYSNFLIRPEFSEFVGVDPVRELGFIMQKKPVYVLKKLDYEGDNKSFFTSLATYLESDYRLEKTFIDDCGKPQEKIGLYRWKGG